MSEVRPAYDDEIDLFELAKTLWDGKWKIIATTFIAAVIGVVFSVVKPNSFEVSTPIQSGNQSAFLQYTPLNDLLRNEGMLYDKENNPNGYIINSDSIFKLFVNEFNDYEEMTYAVSKSEFVQKSIKDLEDDDKQRALIGFAKAFELKAPSKNEQNWTLSFEWHDDLEGMRLVNDAIQKTLSNIRKVTEFDVEKLAEAIDIRNTRKLENLRKELRVIAQNQFDSNKKRIQYLIEQSAIAKELGFEVNILDGNALFQTSQNTIPLSVNSNDFPYYLRGYKAIDKEISIINSRSDEQDLISAEGYIVVKAKISSVEENLSSSQLRRTSEVIANDNPNDWVEFDLAIADVKSQKKSMLYIALSIVLGGMIGVFYILVRNAIRNRREQSATA